MTRCHEVSGRPLPEARPAPALPRPTRSREDWTRLADDALDAIEQGAGAAAITSGQSCRASSSLANARA